MSYKNRVAVIAATICAGVTLGVVGGSNAGAQQVFPEPVSYINPDTGAATANPDVNPLSDCDAPDQTDTQTVGNEATGAGNVHNDACLLDAAGANVDTRVAFQSTGVGVISACPDPDGAGTKTATNSADRKLCVQSGFESGGANGDAGDGEYHVRLVSATTGTQTVTFCADPEGNGCGDATATSTITVTWVPGPFSYINPDTGAATANPDVDPDSECVAPDQTDTQTVGNEATGAGNVHNDACLLDAQGNNVDTRVAFQSTGVGIISGCPDPDGAGTKTATNSTDKKLCVQSGFETGGANGDAGDGEYHVRLVSATPGTQTVTFCADPEGDGCANATATSTITITWVAGPVSYINPDTGAATANTDVNTNSDCATPDQTDTQTVGDEATGAGNVHNDACLFDAQGNDVDTRVAFQSTGVGVISACPDPDGAGGKTATNSADRKLCVQSGFETGGANGTAGDGEYHVRLVSDTPGTQTVTFCADPEGDGCANATATSTITITWVAATVVPTTTTVVPTTTTVVPTITSPPVTAPPLPPPVTLPATGASTTSQSLVGLAFVLAGGSLLVVRRRRIA